jgi:flagellar protein FlgJ
MGNGVFDLKQVPSPQSSGTSAASEKMKEREAKEAKLREVCADFESIFIYNMLQKMRDSVPKSGLMQEMQGKDSYNAMIDQKVAEELARGGGMGLQKMLFDQIMVTDKNFQEGD